jgi:hypothetical protein
MIKASRAFTLPFCDNAAAAAAAVTIHFPPAAAYRLTDSLLLTRGCCALGSVLGSDLLISRAEPGSDRMQRINQLMKDDEEEDDRNGLCLPD